MCHKQTGREGSLGLTILCNNRNMGSKSIVKENHSLGIPPTARHREMSSGLSCELNRGNVIVVFHAVKFLQKGRKYCPYQCANYPVVVDARISACEIRHQNARILGHAGALGKDKTVFPISSGDCQRSLLATAHREFSVVGPCLQR